MKYEDKHDTNCPNCGEDMGCYGLPAFCPDCGTEQTYPEKDLEKFKGVATLELTLYGDAEKAVNELMHHLLELAWNHIDECDIPVEVGRISIKYMKNIEEMDVSTR